MLFFASDFICSVALVATVIGMSNGIVLPTGHSTATANHLDDLIRDVFTSNNSTTTTTNAAAGSNICRGQCVPVHMSCEPTSAAVVNDATDDDVDGQPTSAGNDYGDAMYSDDDAGDGFLDIRIAQDDNGHRRHETQRGGFCAPASEHCCPRGGGAVAKSNISVLAMRPTDEGTPRIANACGFSAEATSDRVTSDGATEIDEFPWMAAILWKTSDGEIAYKCGSTLIHPSVVLTVAHCVHRIPAARLFVRVGQRDIISGRHQNIRHPYHRHRHSADHPGHQDRRIRRVAVHQHFNASRYSLHNDIALLFLDTPVQMGAGGVRAVCLAQPRHSFDRRRCVVSGWGTPAAAAASGGVRETMAGQQTRQLKKIQVPVVSRSLCERSLRTTRLGRRFRLHRSFICAGGEPGRDACTGDGGSPLVCASPVDGLGQGRVRYVQAGIVALGIGCGNSVPGVYVSVAEFRPWIDEQMLSNGYARTFYQM